MSSMKSTAFVAVLLFLTACFSQSVCAQSRDKKDEIPIERCDRLPVIITKVAGENRRFLLDTAAPTILNLKSFTSGGSGKIHIYSWNGSAATRAREVSLSQIELGTRKLRDLKLPAIALSPIGKACGAQIDGILGVDLLDQVGMTIDLKRRVAVPAPTDEPGDSADAFAKMEREMGSCDVAFSQGDVGAMEECFDPEIVFYSQHGEYRGREEVIRYLSRQALRGQEQGSESAVPRPSATRSVGRPAQ